MAIKDIIVPAFVGTDTIEFIVTRGMGVGASVSTPDPGDENEYRRPGQSDSVFTRTGTTDASYTRPGASDSTFSRPGQSDSTYTRTGRSDGTYRRT